MRDKFVPYRALVASVFAIGILLNFAAIRAPYFIDDDTDVLMGVRDINLAAEALHLPAGHIHGPVTLYITKLSGILFGETYAGWRVLQVLSTILIMVLIFVATNKVFGKGTAFFTLCLSASNLFFIFNSKYVGEEIYFVLFNAAAILFFLLTLRESEEKYFVAACLMLGLGLATKITTVWLLLALIIFIMRNRERFAFLTPKGWMISCLAIAVPPLPYLFWVLINERFSIPFYAELFGAGLRPTVPSLFVGYFMGPPGESIAYHLGYNFLGPVQGCIGLMALLACFLVRKNIYIGLLKTIFLTMLLVSLLIFAGGDAEPRHFSPLIIVSIIAAGFFLDRLWQAGGLKRKVVYVLIVALFWEAFLYTSKLECTYYPLHARVDLSAWGREDSSVDLNDLSKAILDISLDFNPTLLVFPSQEWDSVGHFITAKSGAKTMSPLFEEHHLTYTNRDMRRIAVFLTPLDKADPVIRWAVDNQYPLNVQETSLALSGHKLPVKILLLEKDLSDIDRNSIKDLRAIVFSSLGVDHGNKN